MSAHPKTRGHTVSQDSALVNQSSQPQGTCSLLGMVPGVWSHSCSRESTESWLLPPRPAALWLRMAGMALCVDAGTQGLRRDKEVGGPT